MIKIYDSDITYKGTKRKQVRMKIDGGYDKQAKRQAMRDFKEDVQLNSMYREEIKPFKRKHTTIDYWLKFERATILRFNI